MSPIILTIFAFLAVGCLVFGATQVILSMTDKDAKQLKRRLDRTEKPKEAEDKQGRLVDPRSMIISAEDDFPGWTAKIAKYRLVQNVSQLLVQAYPDFGLDKFFYLVAGFGGGAALIVLLFTGSAFVALVAAIMFGLMPFMWLTRKRNKRQRLMEDQIPDSLDFLARSLKAGHSLSTGFQMMGEELPAPINEEFARAYDRHSLGTSMEDALKQMIKHVESTDFAFFVTAVLIQRQTGGDLCKVLENISEMIRQRIRLQKSVKAKTAEGRFTGYILTAFPAVLFVICYVMAPDNWGVLLEDSLGQMMLGGAFCMQLMGLFMIRKMTTLKV
ncbi:MAG: type II secretion system F family protein [Planctomycetota bacterium]